MRWIVACWLAFVAITAQVVSAGGETPRETPQGTPSGTTGGPSGMRAARFLKADGRFDLMAARRMGYQGPIDFSGTTPQLDPRTGEIVIVPRSPKGLEVPEDSRWAGGFGLPGTNGWVSAMVVYDGRLIVAGGFTCVGDKAVGGLAAWDGVSWSALEGAECSISALAVYNGELIAGGHGFFRGQSGGAIWGVARWDGSSWRRLGHYGVPLDCGVSALTIYNGDLIVGGDFESVGGLNGVGCIARWDGSMWHSLGSGVTGGDGPEYPPFVGALAVYGDDLVVGGDFDQAGGDPVSGIASWDGSEWHDMAGGVTGSWDDVWALTIYGADLIVGGSFTHAGGVPASNVARWDGTGWSALGSGSGGQVSALAVYNDELIGDLTLIRPDGATIYFTARWDGSSWQQLGASGVWASAYCVYNGDLFAGDNFETYCDGKILRNIARWDGSAWYPVGEYENGVWETVNALTVHEGRLIAGGRMTQAGSATVQGVASWDGSSWQALGGGLRNPWGPGTATTLTTYSGDLVVGGLFSHAGGLLANNIARWDGSAWHPMGGGFTSCVDALTVYEGRLVAAADGAVHLWDGASWRALGSDSPMGARTMVAYRGQLVVAGYFDERYDPGNSIAAWDGRSWRPLGTGLRDGGATASVCALAVYDGKLFACGYFDEAGGLAVPGIACWDGVRWLAPGIGASLIQPADAEPIYPPVDAYAMATYRGRLFVSVDSGSGSVLVFDGSRWRYMDSSISGGRAFAVTEYDEGLYFGGDFLLAGNKSSVGIARWMPSIPETYVLNSSGSGRFATIQDAIDAAGDGDTIELADGFYTGLGNRDLDFKGKALTLQSQSGNPADCVIDAQGTSTDEHRAFHFHSREPRDCRIRNLRMTGGHHSRGGAILCESPSPENPRQAPGSDFADMTRTGASPTFEGCTIVGNYSSGNGGAGACYDHSSALFTGCDFADNTAQGFGGAVYCGGQSDVWLVGCAVGDNRSGASGGGCVCAGGLMWLDSCVISGNSADRGGGGISATNALVDITGCTVAGNRGNPGSALEADGIKTGVSVRSTIVFGNTGASAISCAPEPVRLRDSDLCANPDGDWVGCVADQAGVGGNFSADPAFCDTDVGDYSLRPESPCLRVDPIMGEYHVGARGVGCE